MRRFLPPAAALLVAASCSESNGPTPGPLDLRLAYNATPAPRAIMLAVRGPKTDVAWSAPTGTQFRLITADGGGDTTHVVIIAPQGITIAAGIVARIQVPDVRQAGQYTATTIQVTTPSYALVAPISYPVTVVRP